MGSVDNTDDDDRCQHPGGCTKSFFTFCPHCRLFICITHLNQHHDAAKNDVRRAIDEIEQQRPLLEQQLANVRQQQIIVNRLYEEEIEALTNMYKFVTQTCTDLSKNSSCYTMTVEYQKILERIESINRQLNKRPFAQLFMTKIEQFLREKDQSTENSESLVRPEAENDDNSMIDFVMLSNNDDDSSSNNLNETKPSRTPISTESSKKNWKLTYSTCPLTRIDVFGLSAEHDVPGIPCNHQSETGSFTFNECVDHLTFRHRLRSKVARIIVQTIASNENTDIDPTTIDLFSGRTSMEIVSQAVSLFIGSCPLTEDNVYGLQSQHNIGLCSPRPPLYLYQHLRIFHHLKAEPARRIINALMNKEPLTQVIFESSEKIKEYSSSHRFKWRTTSN